MKKSTRTVYGALLQTAQRFKQPLPILLNSTLNQKFDVSASLTPNLDEMPFTQYFAIGLNGVTIEAATNGLYETKYREYDPRWASLLTHVPFIMRRLQDDLTAAQRVPYRMRCIETHGGVQYASYYLKKLNLAATTVAAEYRTIVNDIVTPSAWTPTLANLNPVPMPVLANQVLTTGDDYVAATKKLQLVFSPSDIQEIMDAVNIIYGNPNFANITELALVSGVDRVVTGAFNGISASYTEAIYAQVNDFIKTSISCPNALKGQTLDIDAGSNEPLLIYTT